MKKAYTLLLAILALSPLNALPMREAPLSLWDRISNRSWNQFRDIVVKRTKNIEGWCPREKAASMMDLIYDTQPEVCVEIGVFGGSSVIPMAAALKYNGSGTIYGMDPWDNLICCEGYAANDANYLWWKNAVDLNYIYEHFIAQIKTYELEDHTEVLKMTSEDALALFEDESIDILHIDGSHTRDAAMFDAVSYLPKVKTGGYIWFDDVQWNVIVDGERIRTTIHAINYLMEKGCTLVDPYTLDDDYILLQKN